MCVCVCSSGSVVHRAMVSGIVRVGIRMRWVQKGSIFVCPGWLVERFNISSILLQSFSFFFSFFFFLFSFSFSFIDF